MEDYYDEDDDEITERVELEMVPQNDANGATRYINYYIGGTIFLIITKPKPVRFDKAYCTYMCFHIIFWHD